MTKSALETTSGKHESEVSKTIAKPEGKKPEGKKPEGKKPEGKKPEGREAGEVKTKWLFPPTTSKEMRDRFGNKSTWLKNRKVLDTGRRATFVPFYWGWETPNNPIPPEKLNQFITLFIGPQCTDYLIQDDSQDQRYKVEVISNTIEGCPLKGGDITEVCIFQGDIYIDYEGQRSKSLSIPPPEKEDDGPSPLFEKGQRVHFRGGGGFLARTVVDVVKFPEKGEGWFYKLKRIPSLVPESHLELHSDEAMEKVHSLHSDEATEKVHSSNQDWSVLNHAITTYTTNKKRKRAMAEPEVVCRSSQ